MRYKLSDYEWSVIEPMLPKKSRGFPRVGRPPCLEWHILGFAIRRAVARSACELRTSYDLLQSICSLAARWRLGQDHERTDRRT